VPDESEKTKAGQSSRECNTYWSRQAIATDYIPAIHLIPNPPPEKEHDHKVANVSIGYGNCVSRH
jgi:hypothetical protein